MDQRFLVNVITKETIDWNCKVQVVDKFLPRQSKDSFSNNTCARWKRNAFLPWVISVILCSVRGHYIVSACLFLVAFWKQLTFLCYIHRLLYLHLLTSSLPLPSIFAFSQVFFFIFRFISSLFVFNYDCFNLNFSLFSETFVSSWKLNVKIMAHSLFSFFSFQIMGFIFINK